MTALPHAVRGLSLAVARRRPGWSPPPSGCGTEDRATTPTPTRSTPSRRRSSGACRVLTPDDVKLPSNATKTVDCAEPHTAETFAVGELPGSFDDADYDDREVGTFAYDTCSKKFMAFLGADESLVMRTVVSWAWFRPSEKAWDDGARWYRCDVVGGGDESKSYVDLPETAKGLLLASPTTTGWCAPTARRSPSSVKVPCTEEHNWRAVTTIKLGEPEEDYPGDRLVEVTIARLLLRLGRGLAELPDRLRLRLDLVPRGRVGGRQPPLGLLGEDRPVTRARRRARPAAGRAARRLQRLRRRPEPRRRSGPRPPRRHADPDARRSRCPARTSGACYRARVRRGPRADQPPQAGRPATASTPRPRSTSAPSTPSTTATCSPSTPSRSRTASPPSARSGSPTSSAARLEDAPPEHAPGRVVHPDRRGVRRGRRLVPLRRDRAGRQRELAPLTGKLRRRARRRPRAATATACAAPPSPAPPTSSASSARPRTPGARSRRSPSTARSTPASRGPRAPARPPARRPAAASPTTPSTSSGATSGPPRSSGTPARPTACCWAPD